MACRNATRLISAIAVLSLCASASTAFGSVAISAGNRVVLLDSFGSTGGGEFQIYRLDDNGNPPYTASDYTRLAVSKPGSPSTLLDYNTFCIQTDEGINLASSLTGSSSEPDPDEIYKVGGVSDTVFGDTDGSTSLNDPLSSGTEALFFLFATQLLPNYRYGLPTYDSPTSASNRAADADLLQKLLWKLENESSITSSVLTSLKGKGWVTSTSTTSSVTVDSSIFTLASSNGLGTLYDVAALNLLEWTGSSYPSGYPNPSPNKYTREAQDMLVIVDLTPPPSGGEPVPEPASLVAWSLLGAMGMAYGYRRRKAA